MKIAYISDVVYPYVKGGAEKRIYEFSKRLSKRGHEVHVFSLKWWKGSNEKEVDGVVYHGISKALPLYQGSRRSIREAFYFAMSLLPRMFNYKFDVIDCNSFPYLHCYPIRLTSFVHKSRFIISYWEIWDDYWMEYLGSLGIIGKVIEKNIVTLPDGYIVETVFNKKALIAMGADNDSIYLVPSGVNFNTIQEISPSTEKLDVIYVGRLVRIKNVDVFVKSIAYVKREKLDIKAGVIGNGPEIHRLKTLANELGVKNNVRFYGQIENDVEMLSIMKSSKVFVYPSAPEGGWSLAILEANACGLPVIAVKNWKLGRGTEIVQDGYNGLLVNELSLRTLGDQILTLLHNEEYRRKLGINAMTFAQRFDWENQTTVLERVYKEI